MSHKLGFTPASALPWEFTARIRPWTQPLIYYAIAKPLLWLGVSDLFTVVFVLRLLTGLFSLAALAVFARAILPTIPGEEEKRAFIRYLPLFGFLPYLFVRTSSETFSAAFFALGLATAIGPASAARLALAGLSCGLAFESRYQTALMTLGLFGWLAIVARIRIPLLAAFVAGGVAALLERGPVFLMSEAPALPPGVPAGTRATLLYSEYPLTRFGQGQSGVDFMHGYADFAAKAGFLKLLPLHWYTLYRLERSATMRS